MTRILLLLVTLLFSASLNAQLSIAIARYQPLGSTVAISGIITNGPELGGIRYIQDVTGGIAIYDSDVSYFERGDSVAVVGILTDYNGLLEIVNVSGHTVFTQGNPLPSPLQLTPGQLAESNESELVELKDVVFTDGGNVFASNTSYYFSSQGESSSVYIRANHPLIGEPIPVSPVDLVGICSQYFSDYQLLLRDTNDIQNSSSINIISQLETGNLSETGLSISWETDVPGSSMLFYGNTPDLEIGVLTNPSLSTTHSLSITGAEPSELFYVKAASYNGIDTAFSPIKTVITQSLSSGEILAYFTQSVATEFATISPAIYVDEAIDDTLIQYLNRANQTIDFTMYDFQPDNVSNLAEALNAAYDRGVRVRLILDTTWTHVNLADLVYPNIRSLIAPTEEVYGIMHNKFVVIDAESTNPDDPIVWTGSTNYEAENMFEFANNVVIIQDKSLALTYQLEFEEMWGGSGNAPETFNSRFGPFKLNNTPHKFIIGGKRVECYFSPSDGTNAQIIKAIETADHELYVATMLITRLDLAYSLATQSNMGADVNVLVNDKASCATNVVGVLNSALGPNFFEHQEDGIMHHKYLISDPNHVDSDPLVVTGSHNWSNAADNKNDENTLLIYHTEVANWFFQEFSARMAASGPIGIEALDPTMQIKLYPNPAKNSIVIKLTTKDKGDAFVRLLDTGGRELRGFSFPLGGDQTWHSGNLDLPPGIYLVEIETSSNRQTHKLIIQ